MYEQKISYNYAQLANDNAKHFDDFPYVDENTYIERLICNTVLSRPNSKYHQFFLNASMLANGLLYKNFNGLTKIKLQEDACRLVHIEHSRTQFTHHFHVARNFIRAFV